MNSPHPVPQSPLPVPSRYVLKVLPLLDDPSTRLARHRELVAEMAQWAKDEDEFPFDPAMLGL